MRRRYHGSKRRENLEQRCVGRLTFEGRQLDHGSLALKARRYQTAEIDSAPRDIVAQQSAAHSMFPK
jgi:hypothetical protein